VDELIERIRDKDFIETKEGFYQVTGYIHSSQGIVAIPRYFIVNFPTYWYKEGKYFMRVLPDYGPETVEKAIISYSSKYLKFYNEYGARVPEIPINNIIQVYYTNKYDLSTKKDSLYKIFLDIIRLLKREIGLEMENLGLTSTMLIGISNPMISDIDIVIYGKENVTKLKSFLQSSKFEKIKIQNYTYESNIRKTNEHSLKIINKRKWNRLIYKNREISFNPVKTFDEIKKDEKIKKCENLEFVEAKIKVVGIKNPYFYPLEYMVKIEEANFEYEIDRLVIFNDFFIDCFEEGDLLKVKGIIQKINTSSGLYYRLAFGVREHFADQMLIFLD
jgi:predicted nucleotidyltransferase